MEDRQMNGTKIRNISLAVSATLLICGAVAASETTVTDTRQETCFDDTGSIACPQPGAPFYGQDAQHDGTLPGYSISGDGLTVVDAATGLTWLRSADRDGDGEIDAADKLTFAQAQSFPATLNAANFGGYGDWRLPSIKELYSLMDFRGTDPSGVNGNNTSMLTPYLDTDFFEFGYGDPSAGERIIDAQFVSSTEYLSTTMGGNPTVFGLNLADGRIKGYPQNNKTYYVLCVRGNSDYGVNEFIDNGDGTVIDLATGLMWEQSDSGAALNWASALARAEQKNAENYLGYGDWRLPDAKELQSLVDYSRCPDVTNSAAIDPVLEATAIVNEAGQVDYPCYWSGTTHIGYPDNGTKGAYVAFGRAMGYFMGSWQDVHGAGAQRSDPKSGDPGDWPFGHGPQGDAIRIYNHVRLVRTAETDTPLSCTGKGTPSSGEAPLEVSFTATASGGTPPYTFDWDFGDGEYASEQNPIHTYILTGTYNWTLTVIAGGEVCQRQGTITVEAEALSCTASTSHSSGEAPLEVSFTAAASGGTPPYTYDWDFGDGEYSSEQNPTHTYVLTGTHSWTLTVVAGGEICERQGTVTVTSNVDPPTISRVIPRNNPFRLVLKGTGFQAGLGVFIGGEPWSNVAWKKATKIVLKKGAALKALFPRGVPVEIRVVNPDGGEMTTTFTR
jgi:PKD repeat protein